MFKSLKSNQIDILLAYFKIGVDKLSDTKNAVAKMQKKAAKKSKILSEKQAEADLALVEITKNMTVIFNIFYCLKTTLLFLN